MNNIRKLAPFMIIAILVAVLLNQCQKTKDTRNSLEGIIREQNDTIKVWQDKEGRQRASKAAVEAEKDDIMLAYQKEAEAVKELNIKLRNTKSIVTTTTTTVFDTLVVRLEDTEHTTLNDSSGSIMYPQRFRKEMEWLVLGGRVMEDLIEFETIIIRDSLSFITHWESNGLFKPKTLEVQAVSANPYTKFRTLNSINIKKPPQSRIIFGLSAGVGITSKGVLPYVGIGANYRIF
jgi:hypothetical protein